jgi:hypothetical protein
VVGSFATASSLLAGAEPAERLRDYPDPVRLYSFKTRSGDLIYAAWATEDAVYPFNVELPVAPGTVLTQVSMMGTEKQIIAPSGSLSLPASHDPVYWVVSNAAPWLVDVQWSVIDDGTGGSSGDGYGDPEPGERIGLEVSLDNFDVFGCSNVIAGLSSSDVYVTVISNELAFGELAVNESKTNGLFLIDISSSALLEHTINFELMLSGDGPHGPVVWTNSISIKLKDMGGTPDTYLFSGVTYVNGDPVGGLTVDYYNSAGFVGQEICDENGEYSFMAADDLMYYVTATYQGVESTTQRRIFSADRVVNFYFTVDQDAPEVPVLQSPSAGQAGLASTVNFAWSPAIDESGISNYYIRIDSMVYDAGAATNYTKTLSSGEHFWQVRAVDVWGNAGEWSDFQSFAVTVDNPDLDGDLLNDEWELEHFGWISAIDGTADSDGDGASDYNEFRCGTDPLDPDSLLIISDRLRSITGMPGWMKLSWQGVARRRYNVMFSPDPGGTNWLPVLTGVYGLSEQSVEVETEHDSGYFRVDLDD